MTVNHNRSWRSAADVSICLAAILILVGAGAAQAGGIVVGHDVNTLGSAVAGGQEAAFAVNVADFLTFDHATKDILMFESNPGDGARNFADNVLDALSDAGFAVAVTADYETAFDGYDAIFVAQEYPAVGFLDNEALIDFVNAGGGVYLAGGVGPSAAVEAAGWNKFLNHYGLALSTTYNGFASVMITGADPLFHGITALKSGNGQSIVSLGTNPNAQIIQSQNGQGLYALVVVAKPAMSPSASLGFVPTTAAAGGFRRFFHRVTDRPMVAGIRQPRTTRPFRCGLAAKKSALPTATAVSFTRAAAVSTPTANRRGCVCRLVGDQASTMRATTVGAMTLCIGVTGSM
jgi:hypothetical protein